MKWMKIFLFVTALSFVSCSQDNELAFTDNDRIYFEYLHQDPNYAQKRLIVRDSLVVSMGLLPSDQQEYVVKIPINVLGDPLTRDKTYKVEVADKATVLKGETTAKANEHYLPLKEVYTFKANVWTDTLCVTLLRNKLSASFSLQESKSLILRLVETEDLKVGPREGMEFKISMNNYVARPKWWNVYALGYYHPQKYRILLMFNTEEFYSKTDLLNYGDRYVDALKNYLKDNVVIDQETGKRVGFDNLIDMNAK